MQIQQEAMYPTKRLYCNVCQHLKGKHMWGECGMRYIAIVEMLNLALGWSKAYTTPGGLYTATPDVQCLQSIKDRCHTDAAYTIPRSRHRVQEVRMQHDMSPGRQVGCYSQCEGTWFH
jgi:hypothetical protein